MNIEDSDDASEQALINEILRLVDNKNHLVSLAALADVYAYLCALMIHRCSEDNKESVLNGCQMVIRRSISQYLLDFKDQESPEP